MAAKAVLPVLLCLAASPANAGTLVRVDLPGARAATEIRSRILEAVP